MLTIANALSHDVYFKMVDPSASPKRRLIISKGLLLIVALCAAYVTSLKPGDILLLVGAAFSLAASAFFPALVAGIFWKRANRSGAVLGMTTGLLVCVAYMLATYPLFGVNAPLWWGINPISAGIFGMPAGIAGVVIGSLLTAAPDQHTRDWVDTLRSPENDQA
jgi:cation/acetate symporter